jgi:hypothetical protein
MKQNITEKICQEARRLPEPLAKEVFDFIEYIQIKHGLRDILSEHLKASQTPAMKNVWNNVEDEVWNDL